MRCLILLLALSLFGCKTNTIISPTAPAPIAKNTPSRSLDWSIEDVTLEVTNKEDASKFTLKVTDDVAHIAWDNGTLSYKISPEKLDVIRKQLSKIAPFLQDLPDTKTKTEGTDDLITFKNSSNVRYYHGWIKSLNPKINTEISIFMVLFQVLIPYQGLNQGYTCGTLFSKDDSWHLSYKKKQETETVHLAGELPSEFEGKQILALGELLPTGVFQTEKVMLWPPFNEFRQDSPALKNETQAEVLPGSKFLSKRFKVFDFRDYQDPLENSVSLHGTGPNKYQMGSRKGRSWVWLATGSILEISFIKVSENPNARPEFNAASWSDRNDFELKILKILEEEPSFSEPLKRIVETYLSGPIHESIRVAPEMIKKMESLQKELRGS